MRPVGNRQRGDFSGQTIQAFLRPPRSVPDELHKLGCVLVYCSNGNRDVLLSLTGPKEVKRPENGTPRPLLLSLHPDSSFTNMIYLTEQVFAFACHSWRTTFLPVSLPVTIKYSNLIADSLGQLSRLDRWNPDVMPDRIGKTLWFL
jgi:hypothetical protein